MTWFWWLMSLTATASSTPAVAVRVEGGAESVESVGEVRWQVGRAGQLGIQAGGGRTSAAWIDGYTVSSGAVATGALVGTVPLAVGQTVRVDLEGALGARQLAAFETDASETASLRLVTDLSPMATVDAGPVAVRLGWIHYLHHQLTPGFVLDKQGAVLRGEVVWPVSDRWQVAAGVRTGGVFGHGGDGGKYLTHGTASVRFVPDTRRPWTNW